MRSLEELFKFYGELNVGEHLQNLWDFLDTTSKQAFSEQNK